MSLWHTDRVFMRPGMPLLIYACVFGAKLSRWCIIIAAIRFRGGWHVCDMWKIHACIPLCIYTYAHYSSALNIQSRKTAAVLCSIILGAPPFCFYRLFDCSAREHYISNLSELLIMDRMIHNMRFSSHAEMYADLGLHCCSEPQNMFEKN